MISDGDYEGAEIATRGAAAGVATLERGYALWRLRRSSEALELLRGSSSGSVADVDSAAMLQLVAQVEYQMGDYVAAAASYERLFASIDSGAIGGSGNGEGSDDEDELDEDDRMELCTNLAAAYVNADLPRRALAVVERRFPRSNLYELLFNRACALIACGEFAEARQGLSRAEQAARLSMEEDGLSSEQIETGCIIIRTTSAYVDQLCGNEEAAKVFYESVAQAVPEGHHAAAVARNNIVSLRGGGSHDLFDSWKRIRSIDKVKNLTARQRRAVGLNKLSLLVLTGKEKQVTENIAEIRAEMSGASARDGAAGAKDAGISSEDLVLIEAGMLVHKRKESEAKELLQGASELNSCRVRVTLAQFAVREGDYAGAAEILQSTDGIRGTPAGTATVAALYERAGKPEKATKLIRAALDEVRKGGGGGDGKDSKTSAAQRMKYTATLLSAVAAMQMRQQKYQAAADTYGEIIAGSKDESARVAARANLVLACLHFDPARAAKEAEELPAPDEAGTTDSAEMLEMRSAPQNGALSSSGSGKRSNSVVSLGGDDDDDTDAQREKDDAIRKSLLAARRRRIMKRRSKRREAYLAALRALPEYTGDPDKGIPAKDIPKPDPDRWIPKRLRARKRTRRRARDKAMAGGHQGGVVSKEDLERFDAAAKAKREREAAAEHEAAEAKSGKNKKKGKKKKGKKGRRR